jgi:hypothetical protein
VNDDIQPLTPVSRRGGYGSPTTGTECRILGTAPLKPNTKEFGSLPAMDAWQPADVVLFSGNGNVSSITNCVQMVQRQRRYAQRHAQWTHVALYIGSGDILHVNRNNVGIKNLSDYVPVANIRVRTNAGLSPVQRTQIVERAIRLKDDGKHYSTERAFRLALDTFRLTGKQYSESPELFDGIVCSDVVSIAYDETLKGFPLFATAEHQAVLPATLSATPNLTDREITWCQIPAAIRAHRG